MSRFLPPPSAVLVLTALALVGFVLAPVGTGAPPHSGAAVPAAHAAAAHALPTTGRSLSSLRPTSSVNAGGRVYQTLTTPPSGDQQVNRIAVDNATHMVYSISLSSPLLTAFDALTGTLTRSATFGNTSMNILPQDIALDNRSGELFVASVNVTTGVGALQVFQASTLALVTTIGFAGSPDPSFHPYRELYEWHTDQLLVENQSNNDVLAINVTTHTVATFIPVPCTGYTPFGVCDSYYAMFEMNDTFGPLVIVPAASATAWGIAPSSDPTLDSLVTGVTTTLPLTALGPGAFWAFNATVGFEYFENATGNGTLLIFDETGTLVALVTNFPLVPISLTDDPTTGLLVFTVENGSGFGDEVHLINPFFGTFAYSFSNASLAAYQAITNVAFFRLANGSSYAVTAGNANSTGELIALTGTIGPVLSYPTIPSRVYWMVFDSSTALLYELQIEPDQVVALSESTGATLWTWAIPAFSASEWLTVDAADGILYVATTAGIFALSAASGTLEGSFPTVSYVPYYIAYGFQHMLYATDITNDTIQAYSNAGGASSLAWTATITLPATSVPCMLAASPVAEVVVDLACGIGPNAQISTVASLGVVATVPGSYGYSLSFNATGVLFVGNDSTYGVTEYAAGSWTQLRTFPTTVPVDYIGFVPQLNGLVVTGQFGWPADLVSATTGALLASFQTSTPIALATSDPTTGAIAAATTSSQILIATLVALPGVASGLSAVGGNTTLNVSWTAVSGVSGFPVTGYQLFTGPASSGPWTSAGSTTTPTAHLAGLTDGTTYYVTVEAVSGSGTGSQAPAVSGVPAGVPFPPSGATVGSATGSTLSVSWTAPSSTDGAAVTGYTLLFATSTGGPWSTASGGTGLNATISGLSSSTTYYVKVEATNSIGTGHPSAVASGKTGGSSGSGGLLGGSGGSSWLLWIGILVVVILVIAALAAVMMRRRRNAGPGATGPGAPPPGASTPSGSPPPGAMGDPGTPPTAPPPP